MLKILPSIQDPDGDIIPALMAQDEAVFAVLIDRHVKTIHGLASYMLNDAVAAEDISQTVFFKTWQNIEKWEPGRAKLITWMRRVTTNLCLDALKKKRPIYTDQLPEISDDRPEGFENVVSGDRQQMMSRALYALPDRQRAALTLSYYQDVTQIEGAEIMDISVRAYESLLVRARKSLRKVLEMTEGFERDEI